MTLLKPPAVTELFAKAWFCIPNAVARSPLATVHLPKAVALLPAVLVPKPQVIALLPSAIVLSP